MRDIWLISDHHLSHVKLLSFVGKDGLLIRPDFSDVKMMNERILELHNQTVSESDDVYFLGDVMWDKPEAWEILGKMKGRIHLAPGNHDNIPKLIKSMVFEDCRLWYKFLVDGKKIIANHVPLAYGDMKRCDINIHGHIHEKRIDDPRYFNACVEQLGYEPIHIEDVVKLSS